MFTPQKEMGFVLVGLVAALIFVGIAGGIGYMMLKPDTTDESTPDESSSIDFPKKEEDRPVTDFQPYKDPDTISGEWLGDYVVTEPEECAGERGGWKATLTQTGTALSGNYTSDATSGLVSGGAVSGDDVSWSVGGDGDVSFSGKITSKNVIEGSFTGTVCDPEFAPERTKGTFFGGRLVNP
jgi:hypothetical protein